MPDRGPSASTRCSHRGRFWSSAAAGGIGRNCPTYSAICKAAQPSRPSIPLDHLRASAAIDDAALDLAAVWHCHFFGHHTPRASLLRDGDRRNK